MTLFITLYEAFLNKKCNFPSKYSFAKISFGLGEWNKMCEAPILKASKTVSKAFWHNAEKKKITAILSKFAVLCLSFSLSVYYFKIKINFVL